MTPPPMTTTRARVGKSDWARSRVRSCAISTLLLAGRCSHSAAYGLIRPSSLMIGPDYDP